MRSLSRSATLLSLALAVAGCGGPDPIPVAEVPPAVPPADPEVVAVYRDGEVTAADVDRAVLELPAALRQPGPEETVEEWYEGLVREVVIDRLLRSEAELLGTGDDPEVAVAREEGRRQAVVETWLARNPAAAEAVTEDDLRRYYDRHSERYDRQGRRLVSHLFKRRSTAGDDLEGLKAEVAALRQRAVVGESFGALAAEHSDSESRHRQGSLGWVTREGLAPQLAEVIFALPEGVPSEPLATAEGVHLFQVEEIVEAKRFAFDEVAGMIGSQLQRERAREAVVRVAAELPLPAGSFVAGSEELGALLTAGDPEATVFRVGDYELTVARFRGLLEQSREQQGGQPSPELAPELLRALERRERIYRHALGDGLAEDPEVAAQLVRLEDRALLRILRQRSLQRQLTGEPERLQQYYDDNKLRFSSPLRLEVRRLAVPVTPVTAGGAMARLERVAAEAAAGSDRLSALAAELGGEVEELGWRTLGELARLDRRWIPVAAGLEAGQLSPPLSSPSSLAMLEVEARREPEPLPFSTVLERVRAAYLAAHRQELYRRWADEVLAEAGFEVFRDRLQGPAGAPDHGAPDRGALAAGDPPAP